MNKTKLAIIYYSMTGINTQLAEWAKEAGEDAGAEVKLLQVEELASEEAIEKNPVWKGNVEKTKDTPIATSEDLVWADAIVFSTPTRFGNVAAQMKQFLDLQGGVWSKGKLINKVVTAMTSAQNPHGGQEATIKSLYTTMMHWGAIIVPPGYSDDSVFAAGGNPYGTSVTQGQDGKMVEDVEASVKHQVKRTLEVASWIKNGKEK
ncbi:NAD(P)H:quinone oxidoreductase [Senegalia sp. (in: firmicutes)]|uniref:NAD(P)H:quinone oxidoreductase n=1 Tax=Senegalia sp. (in: firmicutes) TaxID=1924098 RepID=UPI003F97EE65